MYQHPLERLLIYTDKKHLDKFPLSETEFNELYELFTTTKNDFLDPDISAVMFFNEVFYYLTTIFLIRTTSINAIIIHAPMNQNTLRLILLMMDLFPLSSFTTVLTFFSSYTRA